MTKFLVLKLSILFGYAASLGIGAYFSSKKRSFGTSYSLPFLALPALIFSSIVALAWFISKTPHILINGKRLVPSISWALGYKPYYGLEEGPLINPIYGPVTYVAYLPTALSDNPTGALLIAALINIALLCFPAALVCFWLRRTGTSLPHATLSFFLIIVWFASDPTAKYMVWNIHADAPQFAFGVLAAAFLYAFRSEQLTKYLFLAATSVTLAAFAKQTAVFLVPALVLYVWMISSWRRAIEFLGLVALIGAGAAALFVYLFGYEELYLNLIQVPAGHPRGGLSYLLDASFEALSRSWWILFVGLVLILVNPNALPVGRQDLKRDWWVRNGWVVFVLCAVFLVPISLLARTKVGGDINSFQFLPYLILSIVVLTAETVRSSTKQHASYDSKLAFAFVTSCLAFSLMALFVPMQQSNTFFRFSENFEQKAFDFMKRNPDEAFFPRNTLATLLATRTLYHWDHGPDQRALAGLPPSNDHILEYMPTKPSLVIYPPGDRLSHKLVHEIPAGYKPATVAELPGWHVYKRL